MQELQSQTTRCALCLERSQQIHVAPTPTFESPDLDGRPAGELRHAMEYWLEECPYCGYVNSSIYLQADLPAKSLHKAYAIIDASDDLPTARQFIKYAWLLQQTARLAPAALQLLRTAWVYDDHNSGNARAAFWRKAALALVERCLDERILDAHPGDFCCLRADLLRRLGKFEAVAKGSLPAGALYTTLHKKLLAFEKMLALRQDDAPHSLDEMPGFSGVRELYYFSM